MHITFYNNHHYWGGLSDNGGSRTVLLSAEALRRLGHEVDVVACADRFTWFEHPHIYREIRGCTDAIVAVSISDAQEIIENRSRFKRHKLFYWARPWENWQMPEDRCIEVMRAFSKRGKVLCNSKWQVEALDKEGISATLQYAGIDGQMWGKSETIVGKTEICFQYVNKEIKRPQDTVKMIKCVGGNASYIAFGNKHSVEEAHAEVFSKYGVKFYHNPTANILRKIYQNSNIYFTPSRREGFHNPPAEASQCGCVVMCGRSRTNGMWDYLDDTCALMYDKIAEVPTLLDKATPAMADAVCKNLERIGDRTHNMKEMLEVLGD